ncbi:general secretion pathway protein GspB [Candidatus Omnitrophota bacterium]
MSIISDALKKAQNARTEENGETEEHIESAVQKKIPFRGAGAIAGGAAILIACIAGGLLLINRPSVSPLDTAARDDFVKKGARVSEVDATTKSFPSSEGTAGPAAIKNLPVLSGLMYSPTHPQAIINGTLVSEGATVDGFTVNKILPNKVLISHDGEEFELNFR